jgi:hypothetical protein
MGATAHRQLSLLVEQGLEGAPSLKVPSLSHERFFFGVLLIFAAPSPGNLLVGVLETLLRIPGGMLTRGPLRSRFISFLHRMVECLGATVLPYLPRALEVLTAAAEAPEVADVAALIVQLSLRFRGALSGLLAEVGGGGAQQHAICPIRTVE